jgi:hypothetical protein
MRFLISGLDPHINIPFMLNIYTSIHFLALFSGLNHILAISPLPIPPIGPYSSSQFSNSISIKIVNYSGGPSQSDGKLSPLPMTVF